MNIELEQVCIDSYSFEAGPKVPKDKASSNEDQSLPSASGLSTCPKTGSGTASSKEEERPMQPTWFGDQTFKCGDPYKAPCPQVDGDPWEKVYRTVKEHDDTMCNAWMDEIQNLLILAGLFSGIVTAFVIETQKLLQEDPTTTSALFLAHIASQLAANSTHAFRINALFFLSLVVSLSTALFGILVLQWIRSYRKQETLSYPDLLGLRQCRYEGLMTWKVPQIVSVLPILLQFGLVVFFTGLVDFLHFLYPKLSIVIGVFVGLVILILVLTTILPSLILLEKIDDWNNAYSRWLNRCRLCAYQSPQAWVFLQSVCWILQNIICRLLAWWNSLPFLTCSQSASWYFKFQILAAFRSYSDWTDLVKQRDFSTWTPYALSWVFQANASNTPGPFWAAYHCFKSLGSTEGMMLTLHDLANSGIFALRYREYWIGDQLPSGQIQLTIS
ncbi:hypothetical protein BJ165DRAFT_1607801 [Panaeolus papilionaceus]|nr:hypothetical protein BJ165DRAFT_1607801 [Panaeolus papilionaceus]